MTRDDVYREPKLELVDFAFDERVAAVFPDMIRRSVPGYELVLPMSALLAARRLERGATPRIYDLGCSLGATTLAILGALDALDLRAPDLEIIAVDNSAAMLARARDSVRDPRVRFVEADVESVAFEPCGAVLMNFTLQFIAPARRAALLGAVRERLHPAGALIVSEKVRFDDPTEQSFLDAAHLDFKRANGYSELEISQKRSALESVMIVDTIPEHLARFEASGFRACHVWYRCLNWASFCVMP